MSPTLKTCTGALAGSLAAVLSFQAAAATTTNTALAQEFERRLKIVLATKSVYTPTVVNLAWTIPSSRVGGEPLASSDISGYDLTYIGRTTGKTGVVHIDSYNQTNYQFSALPADTYDFSIAAYDAEGTPSPMSNVVTVNVQ